jgi:hypothetical protein
VRPIEHASVRGHVTLPHQRAPVGVVAAIVIAVVVPVAIAWADTKSQRTDLNTGATRPAPRYICAEAGTAARTAAAAKVANMIFLMDIPLLLPSVRTPTHQDCLSCIIEKHNSALALKIIFK